MSLYRRVRPRGGLTAGSVITVAGLAVLTADGAPAAAQNRWVPHSVTATLPIFLRLIHGKPPPGRDPTIRVSIPLRTGDGRVRVHRIVVAPDGKPASNIKTIVKDAPDGIGDSVELRAETFWLHRVVGITKPVGVPLPRLKGE